MLELQTPNKLHREMYEDMILEWSQEEDFQDTSPGALFEGKDFQEFLKITKQTSAGENNKRTQSSLFFLVEENKVIGGIDIRHNLEDPYLHNFGGHIGYGIRPSERRKGYATKILELGGEEAKKIGIEKLLISCRPDNIASEKVITKNGGIYDETVQRKGKFYKRYWIIL